MKLFWSKKLPATLLALVMVISLMPSALAAHTHSYAGSWTYDNSNHWHACTESGCKEKADVTGHTYKVVSTKSPTCAQTGETISTCTVCGCKKTETISATGQHSYGTAWKSDNENHWQACTTSGCTATANKASHSPAGSGTFTLPTCTKEGSVKYTCKTCSTSYNVKTSGALGHSMGTDGKCIRCGIKMSGSGSSSGSAGTITYKVAPGKEVGFDRSDFNDLFKKEYDTNVRWVEFEADSSLKNSNGVLYYDYDGDDEETFSKSDVEDWQFYYTSSSYGEYALNDMSFVASKSASKTTVELDFRAYYSSSKYLDGTVEIVISGSSSSSSSSDTVVYEVDPGDEVEFDRSDFNKVFKEEYSGNFRWVTFEASSSLKSSNGTIYFDYDGDDEETFSKSDIDDYDFYYGSSSYGDYALNEMSFVADEDADDTVVELDFTVWYDDDDYVEGTLEIHIGDTDRNKGDGDITYEVDPGDEVEFDRSDFNKVFKEEYSGNFRWVTFEASSSLKSSNGTIYFDYDGDDEETFSKSDIDDYDFYYGSSSYGDYALNEMSFVADEDADDTVVTLEFTVWYDDDDYVEGTLEIRIGEGGDEEDGDITYEASTGEEVEFEKSDFNDFYKEEYSGTIRRVTFTAVSGLTSSNGTLYYNYDSKGEKSFSKTTIDDYEFYYNDEDYGKYPLENLSFVAGDDFDTAVVLEFCAWYSDSKYVDGTLVIQPEKKASSSSDGGDLLYYTTYSSTLQINANDIARFFNEKYPGYTLEYVELEGVPASGSLYYNYYDASSYGDKKTRLTSSNYDKQKFYFSPDKKSESALSELTFIPGGVNYCASIPFTAYAGSSRSVSGTILIGVTMNTISDVYGVTTKGSAVGFPASAIYSAVSSATGGQVLGGIQLLSLPASSVGTIYVGSGTSTKAKLKTVYGYSSGTQKMSQLRFVPASGFTGSVEVPYLAYSTANKVMASGKFSMGVVSTTAKYKDMTSSTWCYKYVTEMSDASVISGYKDNTFRPNGTVTYGEALKLIMLASGYKVQTATGNHWASGYLSKAKSDSLISGTVNLDAPITRLAVAQIAAKAMKLSTKNLSSVNPFTDTTDNYVQALSAAGIIEGYFNNGTSTYKPSNTLTRGQVSAIVWRMTRAAD